MIRTLLFGLNVFAFLLIGSFQKEEVKITQNPPASLKPGESALVVVEIDKSNVTGFAKYQITLDEGLIAEVVESSGASFTFHDQKAKFIWMALPDARKFTLKYRIIANHNAIGNLSMESRFSYIYENERKNHDVPEQIITVGNVDDLAKQQIKSGIEEKALNKTATVHVSRDITNVGINQWKVDLTIRKSNLQGFAKIEETIPNGYTVIDLKSSSAVFSLDDTNVKYIWYDIPESETVFVSYKLLPVIAMNAESPNIFGNLSYLKNEETVTLAIQGVDTISFEEEEDILADTPDMPEEPAQNETPDSSSKAVTDESIEPSIIEEANDVADAYVPEEKTETSTAEPQKDQTVKTPAITSPQVDPNTQRENSRAKTDGNIVNIPEPETGVFYRVQIAAGKNNLKSDTFSKVYNFSEGYKLESTDGLFKYTTGYFQIYKSARDSRERITAKYDKFKGPFVTAYNDGERISVQEALMITNQKWFQ